MNWWIMIDDSFYTLKIANNVADGIGLSVDGIHPTNGVQPLYLMILTPIFYFFGNNPFTPITIAISITSIFNLFAGYFIYRIVNCVVGFRPAIFSLFLWCFSMTVINMGMNGLETSISCFFFVLCAFYYLQNIRDNPQTSSKKLLVLGILLGILGLARVDGMFLAIAIFLDFIFLKKRKRIIDLLPYFIAGLMITPWLLFNFIRMGDIVPISSQAARLISLLNGIRPYFSVPTAPPVFFPIESPPVQFYLIHILGSLTIFKMYAFFIYPINYIRTLVMKLSTLSGYSYELLEVISLLILIILTVLIYLKKKTSIKQEIAEFLVKAGKLNFLLYFAFILILNYSLYVFGMWHYPRYYFPFSAIAAIYTGLFFSLIFDKLLPLIGVSKKIVKIVIVLTYIFFLNFFIYEKNLDNFYGLKTYTKPHSFPLFYYETAEWINKNIPQGSKIGVLESGIIGYFCKGYIIINLDGVQNKDALDACKNGIMVTYMKREGIEYIVGQEVLIRNQVWRRSKMDIENIKVHLLTTAGDERGLRMNIYKIDSW
ncbi:MAG: hypothetical protein HZA77_13565 [Candidatus Schekmanbacteria bacterium]|nr:hypothetical protein [Candidatus Schekmanbacteria bacterium]